VSGEIPADRLRVRFEDDGANLQFRVSSYVSRLICVITEAICNFQFESIEDAQQFFSFEFPSLVQCAECLQGLPTLPNLAAVSEFGNGLLPGFELPGGPFLFVQAIKVIFEELDFADDKMGRSFRCGWNPEMAGWSTLKIVEWLRGIVDGLRDALIESADCEGAICEAFLGFRRAECIPYLGFVDEEGAAFELESAED
jgi:hypothetical protein